MGITIKDPAIGKQAEELAAKYGISVEEAIGLAVREKLQRQDNRSMDEILGYNKHGLFDEHTPEENKASYARAKAHIDAYRALPLYDSRSMDEILGYKNDGTLE